MTNKFIRDVKEVIRRLRNRGISFDANRQYPAIPTIDNTIESHTNALRAIREALETHERRNPRATLDSFVRLYELEDALGGFEPGESTITNIYNTTVTGQGVVYATNLEVDAGTIGDKAVAPLTGAYAYDRLRWGAQHTAGKGTQEVTLTIVSGAIDINCALSNVFAVELNDNVVFNNPTNQYRGQVINIRVKQDVTGGRTATFGTDFTFTNKIDPTLSTDPGSVDLFSCQWDHVLGKWLCTHNPNYGAGYADPGADAVDFVNIGGGSEVYKETVTLLGVPTVRLRTLLATGDISLTQNADDITISYSGTPGATTIDGLTDVDTSGVVTGATLVFDGETWVSQAPRRWTTGCTWTNGALPIGVPVNAVAVLIPDAARIVAVYVLGQGGSGDCEIDIRKTPYSGYPPGPSNSIVDVTPPSVTGAEKSFDGDLTGWDVDVAANDILTFHLTSCSVFSVVQLVVVLERAP